MLVRKSGRDRCPGVRNVHFQLPSVAQKCHLLKLSISALLLGLFRNPAEVLPLVQREFLHKSRAQIRNN